MSIFDVQYKLYEQLLPLSGTSPMGIYPNNFPSSAPGNCALGTVGESLYICIF